MTKKTNIFFISIFIIYFLPLQSFNITEEIYKKSAKKWIQNYIYNETNKLMVTKQDLQALENLCFISYQRSFITLKAQKAALESLTSVWQGWQNIAQNRLDPAKKIPHLIDQEKKTQTLFWKLHDEYALIGTEYTKTIEKIVDGDHLKTLKAAKAVDQLRAQARAVVAQSLINIQSLLGKLFYTPKKHLLGDLLNYIPHYAMNSFIQANNINNKFSEESWNVLKAIQTVGAQTWEKIEEGRASYYLAHHQELLQLMQKLQTEKPIDQYI
ncbi:hypothetical protein KAH94_00720 [bacterium]|nr:hypothetical protein [bacterium]